MQKIIDASSLCYSALVWGSSAKHKPQRVGKVDPELDIFMHLCIFFFPGASIMYSLILVGSKHLYYFLYSSEHKYSAAYVTGA